MRYVYFEFENFRGIKQARLELATDAQARISTLVGLNESGKTTILEAIDYFSPTTSGEEINPKQLTGQQKLDPNDLIPISKRTNFNEKIVIRAGLELSDEDIAGVTKLLRSRTGFRLTRCERNIQVTVSLRFENSKFVGQSTLWPGRMGGGLTKTGRVHRHVTSQSMRAEWQAIVEYLTNKLPRVWLFQNFLFEFPGRIVLSKPVNETLSNRFYRTLFQDILDSLDKGLDVDTHVIGRARSRDLVDRNNLQQLLIELSRHVTYSVVAAWGELFANRDLAGKRVSVQLAANEDSIASDGLPSVAVEFWLEDVDGLFSIQQRSLGFRWFFVYLLLTSYRGRRREDESDMLFLFDEPASNLHSTAQAALLASLERLSLTAHVVYTTHSHHLINPRWLSSAFVVLNEGLDPRSVSSNVVSKSTDIRVEKLHVFAAQHPSRSYYFQPVLEMLDYAPSQLEMVPAVIMVEGKSDYYFIRYFAEVLKVDHGSSDPLNILPGTGAGSLDEIIKLYLGWAREFVILLDGDVEGRQQTDRYMKNFGPILRGRLLTLADIISDVSGIESMLEPADIEAFQRVVACTEPGVNKKALTRGVQLAFASRTVLPISETARHRFGALITELAARLLGFSEAGTDGRPEVGPP